MVEIFSISSNSNKYQSVNNRFDDLFFFFYDWNSSMIAFMGSLKCLTGGRIVSVITFL